MEDSPSDADCKKGPQSHEDHTRLLIVTEPESLTGTLPHMPVEMPTKPARLDAAAATPRTTRAKEVSTSEHPCRRQYDVLHHWSRCHCRSWYDVLHHGACAAIAAGAGVMNSTTGARAAITAGPDTLCTTTAQVLRSLQELV